MFCGTALNNAKNIDIEINAHDVFLASGTLKGKRLESQTIKRLSEHENQTKLLTVSFCKTFIKYTDKEKNGKTNNLKVL